MRIAVDENIPFAEQAFSSFGEVSRFNGRAVQNTDLQQTDVLLVRSVTRVDESLLRGTPVQFVGTATIGVDHIDQAYLAAHGIGFAHAPGCNATAASEYVLSALLIMAQRQGFALPDKRVGIIGCGNVGSRVKQKLEALGMECLVNDPPLQEQGGAGDFVDLATALEADVLTLHVPLEKTGPHPTAKLADTAFFNAMRPDAIFINTARGAVMDEAALHEKLTTHADFQALLDVWDGEPRIDQSLLARAALGTPHIAGYSFDGKVRGTEMLYTALCKHLDRAPQWRVEPLLPPPPVRAIHFSREMNWLDAVHSAVMACYDVRRDDSRLRRLSRAADAGAYFDQLRKQYPMRREFSSLHVSADDAETAAVLRQLGFSGG